MENVKFNIFQPSIINEQNKKQIGYISLIMDRATPNNSQKHIKNNHENQKQQALQSLKNCIEYISQIFKICHISVKQAEEPLNIFQCSNLIEKALKKLVNLMPRYIIPIETHHKLTREFDQVNQSYQSILKTQRDYKCQLDVLQKRLAQVEKRQQQLIRQREKDKAYTNQFETKLNKAKRQSELKLQKIVKHLGKQEELINSRKRSLPSIINHSQKYKIAPKSSLLLIGSPSQQSKTQRLVQHLRRKY